MSKIYLAGPMFNKAEKDFNQLITTILEENGYSVFLPQRDGVEFFELKDKTEQEITKIIFDTDTKAILEADILFMVLDGRVPDEGACVELGIAYANKKRCYGIKSDVRSAENGMDLNPLIAGCFRKIFKNFDGNKAIKEIKEYLAQNKL